MKIFIVKKIFYTGLCVFVICLLYNTFILPRALMVTKNTVLAYVNICIARCVQAAAPNGEMRDVCDIGYGADGRIISVTADGMAVNRICADIAERLSCMLADGESRVYIGLGALTGVPFLADKGPRIPVGVSCTGGVTADYETGVKSIGINQVAFCLYINVHTDIQAYNPVVNSLISLDKRIMLAEVVYAGNVPDVVGSGAYTGF